MLDSRGQAEHGLIKAVTWDNNNKPRPAVPCLVDNKQSPLEREMEDVENESCSANYLQITHMIYIFMF